MTFVIGLLLALAAVPASLAMVRTGLGAERAARVGGLVPPLVFLIVWAVAVRPGWFAYDALGRIGHIVAGGALLGLALDLAQPPRWIRLAGGVVFLLVCAWAEVNGGLWTGGMPPLGNLAALCGASILGGVILWRFDVLRAETRGAAFPHAPAVMLLSALILTLALAAIAAAVADATLARTALILAAVISGQLAWVWWMQADVPEAALLGIGGTVLATAWAIFERNAGTGPGLVCSGLILFAHGTAARVPLPKAGISRWIAPLVLAAASAAPLVLAVLMTLALKAVI
jgi:hypothetical protein